MLVNLFLFLSLIDRLLEHCNPGGRDCDRLLRSALGFVDGANEAQVIATGLQANDHAAKKTYQPRSVVSFRNAL